MNVLRSRKSLFGEKESLVVDLVGKKHTHQHRLVLKFYLPRVKTSQYLPSSSVCGVKSTSRKERKLSFLLMEPLFTVNVLCVMNVPKLQGSSCGGKVFLVVEGVGKKFIHRHPLLLKVLLLPQVRCLQFCRQRKRTNQLHLRNSVCGVKMISPQARKRFFLLTAQLSILVVLCVMNVLRLQRNLFGERESLVAVVVGKKFIPHHLHHPPLHHHPSQQQYCQLQQKISQSVLCVNACGVMGRFQQAKKRFFLLKVHLFILIV